MDSETLKSRSKYNLPIYLGDNKITVINIYEILNIVEIEFESGRTDLTEISCLSEVPDNNQCIPISLFAPI